MADNAARVKTLVQGVADDRQRYIALHALLEEQRQHILSRRTEALKAVNARIMALYKELDRGSQQRHRLLCELGITASAYGMHSLLARLPEAHRPKVSALWSDLLARAAGCQSANDYNGTLMNMQQEILANVMNVGEPENWLYGEER